MHNARLSELPHHDSSSDDDLVRRILSGDKTLYAALMRRYNQRLYRVVRAIIRQDHEAEDVVQYAYVTAYAKLSQFRGEASFGTWLTRIAINEAFARIRKAKRQSAHLELVESGGESSMDKQDRDPEAEAQRREMRALLESKIDELPENLRIVFMMRDVQELNTAETAASLGLSEEAVRVRLHRARSLMRERLSSAMENAPDAFHFAGERCDRIILGVLNKLGI